MNKDDKIRELLKEGKSYRYISKELKCSNRRIQRINKKSDTELEIIIKDSLKLSKLEQYMTEHNLSEKDLLMVAESIGKTNPYHRKEYSTGNNHNKFIVFGDTHIGNLAYDKQLMKHAAKIGKKEKVDFFVHGGDIADGWYQNRPLQLFELEAIGFDQQLKLAVEELSQIEQPLYFITANHENNTFMRGAGVELGTVLEDKLKQKGMETYFLGNAEADMMLGKTKYKILHPDGGTAYAISYRPQKIAESFGGGEKPELLSIHHFHKAEYLFYRNIHIFQAGTFENQTPFMRGKNIPANKGFWLIDMYSNDKGGIDKITPTFYPSYD